MFSDKKLSSLLATFDDIVADDSAGSEVARSKILQLGGEFLSELRGKQLKALMVN